MTEERLGAHATYRALIDDLVARTPSTAARFVRERGHVGRVPDPSLPAPWMSSSLIAELEREREQRRAENDLVARLSLGDRETLARLLQRERSGAMHDALATLTEYLACRDVEWSVRGERMPVGYEGGLHQDYVGRLSGDYPWPARREVEG